MLDASGGTARRWGYLRFCDRALLLLDGNVQQFSDVAEALSLRVKVADGPEPVRQEDTDDEWQDE